MRSVDEWVSASKMRLRPSAETAIQPAAGAGAAIICGAPLSRPLSLSIRTRHNVMGPLRSLEK
jgi:hypothetical protein